MPTIFFHAASCLLLFSGAVNALDKPQLTEVFRDDFNTEDGPFNSTQWSVTHRDTLTIREVGYYRSDNAAIKNGSLVLRVQRQKFGATNYTAARVETIDKFSFLYGEVEWRAKIYPGEGFWAGLWIAQKVRNGTLIADFSPPAACFMDYTGHITMRAFHAAPGDSASKEPIQIATGVYSNIYLASQVPEFHTYRMVWTRNSLEWYVDDHKAFWVDEAQKIPQHHLQLVMNMAVGGPFALQTPDPNVATIPTIQMEIDYVVVRQNRGGSTSGSVPVYVGATIGLLSAALFVVILAGGIFFYKYRQHDRVVPRGSRRESASMINEAVLERDG